MVSAFVTSGGRALQATQVFDAYWRFAYERQEIFFRRLAGHQYPWTTDPILDRYRFTNVYRASDRVSQFLIRNVIYEREQEEQEVVFRTLLFKLFNKIETWTLLNEQLGPISWRSFNLARYDAVLSTAMKAGASIYSPAYIMPSPSFEQAKKHSNHLLLLSQIMKNGTLQRLLSARSLRELYLELRSVPSFGNFLAFQYAIDLNYSGLFTFSEMEFVVAGPGAKSGIRKAFKDTCGLSDEEIIAEMAHAADAQFSLRGLSFRTLWGRSLQLIDCQNLFCEIDKYSRVAFPAVGGDRSRIKRRFMPAVERMDQWYPPKWNLKVSPIERVAPPTSQAG